MVADVKTTVVGTASQKVEISHDEKTVIIGERINPTNRPVLTDQLSRGELSLVLEEARSQKEEGADIVDVNVGAAGVNEEEVLPRAVAAVVEETGCPVAVDSSHRPAIVKALEACEGKHVINSVTGEEESLSQLLPVAAEKEAVVIGLCMGEEGIPDNPEDRLKVAERIVESAVEEGVPEQDIILDPMVTSLGTDDQAARIALETTEMLKSTFGMNITMGASNVSFGLPARDLLNSFFLSLAIRAGANVPIVNPAAEGVMKAVRCADLIGGKDRFASAYLKFYRSSLDD